MPMEKKDKKQLLNLKMDVEEAIPPELAEEKYQASKESYKELTNKKKSSKSKLLSLLFFLVNIVVVVIIAVMEFSDENRDAASVGEALSLIGQNSIFLLCILGLIVVFYLLDMLKMALLMKSSTGKFRWGTALKSSVLCKYYDNITPFGSGGQPFQMYYLSRKIPIGPATSLPLINFFITQLAFFIICVVDFIFFPADVSSAVLVMAYGGAILYIIVPFLAVLFSFMPRIIDKTLTFIVITGAKMHLIKEPDKTLKKWISNVVEYRDVFKLFTKNIGIVFIVFVLSVMQCVSLHSIPYFVFRLFGVTDIDWWKITVMTTYIYSAITFIPTPGNSGAAEGTFYAIFASLGGFLFWGMLIWRLAVFYLVILVGLCFIFVDSVRKYRRAAHFADAKSEESDKLPADSEDGLPPSEE